MKITNHIFRKLHIWLSRFTEREEQKAVAKQAKREEPARKKKQINVWWNAAPKPKEKGLESEYKERENTQQSHYDKESRMEEELLKTPEISIKISEEILVALDAIEESNPEHLPWAMTVLDSLIFHPLQGLGQDKSSSRAQVRSKPFSRCGATNGSRIKSQLRSTSKSRTNDWESSGSGPRKTRVICLSGRRPSESFWLQSRSRKRSNTW